MAQNIATLAVKFIADTFGLKAGAKDAEKIVSQSAKAMGNAAGNTSQKAFNNFFKPGGNNASMTAFNKFFAAATPKIVPGSPFAAGWTPPIKPLTLMQRAAQAATNSIQGQGGLAGAFARLGPAIGLSAGAFAAGAAVIVVALAGIAAAGYVAYKAMEQFNASAARIDATSKLATRLDLTYASLQKLTFAAGREGVGITDLARAMEHMGRTMGSGGMSLEDRFAQQAKRIAAIKDPAARAKEAYRVFGREAGNLIPVLKALAENAARFDKYAGTFGFKIDEQDSKNVERMQDAWGDLLYIGTQLADKFVSKFAGPVAAFLETVIVLTENWAKSLGAMGVTWEDVGGFAINLMKELSSLMQLQNAQLKINIGLLLTAHGINLKIAALALRRSQKPGDDAIESGREFFKQGVATTKDFFSGKLGRRFDDMIVNGTDFSKRGGFKGEPDAYEQGQFKFSPSADRFSVEAAKIINQSGQTPQLTPAEHAAKETAANTAEAKRVLEKIWQLWQANPPIIGLGEA